MRNGIEKRATALLQMDRLMLNQEKTDNLKNELFTTICSYFEVQKNSFEFEITGDKSADGYILCLKVRLSL